MVSTRFIRRGRRSFTRRKRRWQWIRSTENSVTVIPAAGFAQHDLLSTYRTTAGIDVNLPEFTIWRIRIKVSFRISAVAATQYEANDGVHIAVFVDDMNDTGQNPVVAPYDEKYMLWDAIYASESLQYSSNASPIGTTPVFLFREYDIKTHRRIENLKETLLFQVGSSGQADIENHSWTQNTLVLLGH